ncbi:hypothetical protein L218DRAFT_964149 [Marasmius fiardii PR-910]|nr:hypothetical protein L218DRAFT_964149 [Marasmius fiardii PR-910]
MAESDVSSNQVVCLGSGTHGTEKRTPQLQFGTMVTKHLLFIVQAPVEANPGYSVGSILGVLSIVSLKS